MLLLWNICSSNVATANVFDEFNDVSGKESGEGEKEEMNGENVLVKVGNEKEEGVEERDNQGNEKDLVKEGEKEGTKGRTDGVKEKVREKGRK